jgi:BirA family transcriptional regulator, biotin operon repressor / biotin---[acetyl-CoA-carboxylase] ligase
MRAENRTPARMPLDAAALRRAAVRPGGLWRDVEVVACTGSTNADLLARALRGEPEGAVLAAEEQSAGRGRMGRSWVSPPRAALTFSMLVRPASVPPARRGWLPLLTGVAVAEAVTSVTGVPAKLKWPNDVLAGPGKLGGILAEASGDAVVVGVGLNVSAGPEELPPPGPGALAATSLRIASQARAAPDRETLLLAILAGFERWYQAWRQAGGEPDRCGLRAEYIRLSGTIGRLVRAELPGGQALSGSAVGVDPDGRLLVRVSPGTEWPVAAGDVVHLR